MLIGSALPLLRDFGIIVTLNVAIALLAALVVMPPMLVWADTKGYLLTGVVAPERAVVLATRPSGIRAAVWAGALVVVGAIAFALFATSETTSGVAEASSFTPQARPTTTTTTAVPVLDVADAIDPSTFGTERPAGLIDGMLFDKLTAQGAAPNQAVCAGTVVLERFGQQATARPRHRCVQSRGAGPGRRGRAGLRHRAVDHRRNRGRRPVMTGGFARHWSRPSHRGVSARASAQAYR